MSFPRILKLSSPIFFSLLFTACWGKQSNVPKGNGSGFTGVIKKRESSPALITSKANQVGATKLTKDSKLSDKNYSKSNSANALDYIAPEMGKNIIAPEASIIAWEKSASTTRVKYQSLKNVELPVDTIESLEKTGDETIAAVELPLPNTIATTESKKTTQSTATMALSLVAQSEVQYQSSELTVSAAPSDRVIFWAQKNEENKLVEKTGAVRVPEQPYQHPVQDVWNTYQQNELSSLTTDDFTISASFRFINDKKINFLFNGPNFQVIYFSGNLEFRFLEANSTTGKRLFAPLTIKAGSAHRIQIVRSHSNLSFYLDGQQVDETTIDGDLSPWSDLDKLRLFSPVVNEVTHVEFDEVKIALP